MDDETQATKEVAEGHLKTKRTARSTPSDSLPKQASKRGKGGTKSKHDATFESMEMADHYITPTLEKVKQLMRRTLVQPYVPGSLNRLKLWLSRMERGNKLDSRTPFFKRMTYQAIQGMVMKIVDRNAEKTKAELSGCKNAFEVLRTVEDHQAKKISPRGVFPPAHVWLDEKIKEVWTDKPPKPELNREALNRALSWLSNLVPAGSLDVDDSSISEGFEHAGTKDASASDLNVETNSCYPTWVKKWYHKIWDKTVSPVQRMTQSQLVERSKAIWLRAMRAASYKDIDLHFVATANQRTNVGSGFPMTEENTYKGVHISKLRAVCAMDKIDTILGKPILNRLISAVKEIRNPDGTRMFVALTTPQQIDKNLQVCLQTARRLGLICLSTDFSGYDASVSPWLAFETAQAVSKWMTKRMANIFLALVYGAFYQTRCITTTQIFPEGPSSMKSGSWLTNIMDSLINLVGQRYGLEAGHYKSIADQFVQGDDAILLGEGCTPDAFEKASAELGFTANADKQYYEEGSLAFCQKIHIIGYPGGIYPIARATASCVSLEDDVGIETDDVEYNQFPYVLAYRTVCRLDNACFNPNFVELVKMFEHDDHLLQLGANMPAASLAKLAGSYASKYQRQLLELPHKGSGPLRGGFERLPVNRVLRGELPPPPGVKLFEWVYEVSYDNLAL